MSCAIHRTVNDGCALQVVLLIAKCDSVRNECAATSRLWVVKFSWNYLTTKSSWGYKFEDPDLVEIWKIHLPKYIKALNKTTCHKYYLITHNLKLLSSL